MLDIFGGSDSTLIATGKTGRCAYLCAFDEIGTQIEDYEFTGNGDLDEGNGMTVYGQYGYYVTTSYARIIKRYSGAPNASFKK